MKKVSKFFKHIQGFFKNVFSKEFAFLKKNSALAVKVTNTLKDVVENPITSFVVNLIPGDVDNRVLERLKVIVPKIAKEMALAHGMITQASTNSDAVAAIVKYLQAKHPDGRVAFWLEFSGRVNLALSDGELSLSEAVALAQMVYAETAKK